MLKNFIPHSVTTKKGSVLIFSLIVLSFIMVAALGIASTTLLDRKASIVTSNSTSALQLADTGIEKFLQELYQNEDLTEVDTLDELADKLGTGVMCEVVGGGAKIDVAVGDQQYTLIPKGETALIDPTASPSAPTVSDIPRCNYPLAVVSTIKVIGNNKNTARALEIDITKSIDRGLLAHWNLEDNAVAETQYPTNPGSPKARDGSAYNHVTTLCPADQDAESFSGCPCYDSIENQEAACPDDFNGEQIGFPHGSDRSNSEPIDEHAWVDGIVNESGTGAAVNSQALRFDASKFHYLMMNTSSSACSGDCYDKLDQENLEFDRNDQFSFSVWFKSDQNTPGTILSRMDVGDAFKGYDLILADDKAKFQLINAWEANAISVETASSGDLTNGKWHHVVVTYDGTSRASGVTVYVDGDLKNNTNATHDTLSRSSTADDSVPFHIGRRYNSDNSTAEALEGNHYFEGLLDDIRIYDRVIADFEVAQLCRHGKGDGFPEKCPKPSTLVTP